MVLPYFDYCDVVYQGANKEFEDLDVLQRLQNKCLKLCQGLGMRHPTKEVHRLSKCALLEDPRAAHTCNFMYLRKSRVELID